MVYREPNTLEILDTAGQVDIYLPIHMSIYLSMVYREPNTLEILESAGQVDIYLSICLYVYHYL